MSFEYYLFLSAITLFAAFVQGLSGFGFTLVMMSFVTIFLPVDESAVIVTILVMPLVFVNLIMLRKHVNFKRVLPVLITMLIGLPIGILGLVRLSEGVLLLSLGVFVIITVVINEITVRGKTRNLGVPAAAAAGLLSGMFGGAFAVSGPPIALYFTMTVEEKRELKASMLFIMMVQIALRLMILILAGLAGPDLAKTCLILAVPLAAGAFAGLGLFNRAPSALIRRIVQILLVVSSTLLIIRAV